VRALLFASLLSGAGLPAAAAQVTARADSLYSPSVGQTMRFVAVLPDGYDSTGSYPVQTPPDALPFIYMAIGTADEFHTLLPRNREFADSLRAYGAMYSYTELPAHHSWVFWNRVLPDLLSQVWQTVTAPRASSPD